MEGDCEIILSSDESKVLTGGQKNEYETDGRTGLGMAVDIGTTTMAAYLMDMQSGRELSHASMLNPQRIHGADVVSRLEFECASDDNRVLLQEEISAALTELADILLEKAGRSGEKVENLALVGNTVMMHMAGGYDARGIAKAPFTPAYTQLHSRNFIGMNAVFGGCVSGYVGADTLGAMLACDFDKHTDNVLLIDIGTNGEIALTANGRYLTCSCAAGPAFEGAHIACGTGAVDGAMDHLFGQKNGFGFTTIKNEKISGICGSGLIDAAAYLLEEEEISPVGRMSGRFDIAEGVYIDPADIREVQLAKAAIAAGIEILVDRAGITYDDISEVYLAGGFGNYINISSACRIGLLPVELEKKIKCVGNAAGDGAKMQLLSEKARRRAEEIRNKTDYIELSAQDEFEDVYTDNLMFEE